jgi:O-methyltransferase
MKGPRPIIVWLASAFWSTKKGAPLREAFEMIRSDQYNIFAGDDMILFGRAMSFAYDEKFMEAFQATQPDLIESAIIWRSYVLYWAARQALERPGDFVEAGVYKGTTARLICNLTDFATLDRTYWLYDAFGAIDAKLRLGEHTPELEADVRQRFADVPNARIVAGHVPQSFAQGEPEGIALLHLDMNNVAAEQAVLERFYDRLVPGACLILDDYGHTGYWPQKDMADEFAAARNKMILELPAGQGLLIR